MRILTVRQPWAWAIIHGGKTVENRSANVAGGYRGPVAIHAGLQLDDSAFADATLHNAWLRAGGDSAPGGWGISKRGRIIGVVDLVDVHLCSGECSPWAHGPVDLGRGVRDLFHMEFTNPRPLVEPIPYTGALGLRNLAARDPETVLAITRQIGSAS